VTISPYYFKTTRLSSLTKWLQLHFSDALACMGNQLENSPEKDTESFQAIFVTFFPKVQAMLMRQGADKETAEEIAQDTLFAVWRNSHQFSSDKGRISAWIYAIARNLRIDRLRRQAVWQRSYGELHTLEHLHGAAVDDQPWVGERSDVESALDRLPPDQLEVIQLSFIDGLSQAEIAKKLGLPLGTVKSRMRLAFKKLRSGTGRDG
jgi:RNA polymerase sigma-70 factor (ECF subfamily)